ncbi:MFS transporter [Nocardia halotolerans]|uniref:MFS transporter n=1 Tax=Nocardia halotolerans TaxID=1755878 RepID=A0ABV8VJW2_9NOCA
MWYYCAVYTCMMIGFYWGDHCLPQITKHKMDIDNVQAGLLSAIPWVVATIALGVESRYTSRHGKRGPVLTIFLLVSAAGMLISSLVGAPVIALIGLCLGACIQAAVPLLYSFPSQHFPGAMGAVALAMVNSAGNIGGFSGPTCSAGCAKALVRTPPVYWC